LKTTIIRFRMIQAATTDVPTTAANVCHSAAAAQTNRAFERGPMSVVSHTRVLMKRFWSDPGIDIRGIARAFVADVTGGATQGASTIAQQFVKNSLSEQNNRTIFEKLREAALAYHLTHEWHRWQILTSYLNTIYFGHGAYGVESAARVACEVKRSGGSHGKSRWQSAEMRRYCIARPSRFTLSRALYADYPG